MKLKLKKQDILYGMGSLAVNKSAKSENGTFEFVASGIKVDRYGEIVDPSGWDFKAFKKNPVMLWGHNSSIPAIAKVTKIWKDDKQVYAQAEWAPTEFAQEIRMLVEAGFINAVSVGFLPREWEGEWPSYKYIDQELLEISVVNVPAYADALISQAKKMGLKVAQKAFEAIKVSKDGESTATGENQGDKSEPEVKTITVDAVEMIDEGVVLHFSSGERNLFKKSESMTVKLLEEETATGEETGDGENEKNVIQFTQEEFAAFKKEMSEPISIELKKQLNSLIGVLDGSRDVLKAFVASSEEDHGRNKDAKEKAPVSVDVRELTKIASKVVEMSLLQMRSESKK